MRGGVGMGARLPFATLLTAGGSTRPCELTGTPASANAPGPQTVFLFLFEHKTHTGRTLAGRARR